jgi:ribonuclease Z
MQDREAPLPIYGPVGTSAHVKLVFSQLFGYIPELLSARGKKFDVPVSDVDSGLVIDEELRVSCARVIHGSMPTLGYRVDLKDGSVGFSGDTAPCDALVQLVKGVNLLIHECPFPDKRGPHPAHTIPRQLGPIAAQSEARALAMNHFFPICDTSRDEMIESVRQTYPGDIIFGEDLMTLTLK